MWEKMRDISADSAFKGNLRLAVQRYRDGMKTNVFLSQCISDQLVLHQLPERNCTERMPGWNETKVSDLEIKR